MDFEWDPKKNVVNITKHGFDFENAEDVFKGHVFAWVDRRKDYGEERWNGIGLLGDEVVLLVWTLRQPDRVRIISMRKAGKREREDYAKTVKDGLGTD